MKKTRKAYSAEFKREAVRLVKGGLTASQVARDLGVVGNVVAPIHFRTLPGPSQRAWHHVQHESKRKLLGQCSD